MNPCASCGKSATLRCTRCRVDMFCDRECQIKHFKLHKGCGKNKENSPSAEIKNTPKTPQINAISQSSSSDYSSDSEPRLGNARRVGRPKSPIRATKSRGPLVPLYGQGYIDWLDEVADELPELMLNEPKCGFTNSHSNCYLNAALQALACTPSLHALLQEARHLELHNSPRDCFLCAFEKVSIELVTSMDPINPYWLTQMTRSKMFGNSRSPEAFGGQADAQECLGFLLELMQESIIPRTSLQPAEIEELERSSMIGHLFSFDLGQSVYCRACSKENLKESVDYYLRLEITTGMSGEELARLHHGSGTMFGRRAPSVAPCDVKELIEHYLRPEPLSDYKCEGCERRGTCEKRTSLLRLPNILIVLLDQNKSTGMWGKVNREVLCPSVLKLSNCEYALYAMIVHLDLGGSTFFGHYVCYVRGSGDWWLCDDEEIIRVSNDYVEQQQPLLVLYQALDPIMEPPGPRDNARFQSVEEEVFSTPRSDSEHFHSMSPEQRQGIEAARAMASKLNAETAIITPPELLRSRSQSSVSSRSYRSGSRSESEDESGSDEHEENTEEREYEDDDEYLFRYLNGNGNITQLQQELKHRLQARDVENDDDLREVRENILLHEKRMIEGQQRGLIPYVCASRGNEYSDEVDDLQFPLDGMENWEIITAVQEREEDEHHEIASLTNEGNDRNMVSVGFAIEGNERNMEAVSLTNEGNEKNMCMILEEDEEDSPTSFSPLQKDEMTMRKSDDLDTTPLTHQNTDERVVSADNSPTREDVLGKQEEKHGPPMDNTGEEDEDDAVEGRRNDKNTSRNVELDNIKKEEQGRYPQSKSKEDNTPVLPDKKENKSKEDIIREIPGIIKQQEKDTKDSHTKEEGSSDITEGKPAPSTTSCVKEEDTTPVLPDKKENKSKEDITEKPGIKQQERKEDASDNTEKPATSTTRCVKEEDTEEDNKNDNSSSSEDEEEKMSKNDNSIMSSEDEEEEKYLRRRDDVNASKETNSGSSYDEEDDVTSGDTSPVAASSGSPSDASRYSKDFPTLRSMETTDDAHDERLSLDRDTCTRSGRIRSSSQENETMECEGKRRRKGDLEDDIKLSGEKLGAERRLDFNPKVRAPDWVPRTSYPACLDDIQKEPPAESYVSEFYLNSLD